MEDEYRVSHILGNLFHNLRKFHRLIKLSKIWRPLNYSYFFHIGFDIKITVDLFRNIKIFS